jgi:VWFA-related protein
MKWLLATVAGVLLGAAGLSAQTQPPAGAAVQPASTTVPTIRTTAQEVVLDMVFRDKKGKTLKDIRPEEVHIFDDGAEQKLNSLRLIEGKTALPVSPAGAPAAAAVPLPLDPLREIRLVTLVFEGLDLDGKRFFRQAAKDILAMAPEQNLYFSLMTVDQRLQCIQPFTNNRAELLKSLERSQMWSFIQLQNQSSQVKARLQQTMAGGEPMLQAGGAPGAGQAQSVVNYRMAKMQYDMLQAAETADQQNNMRATLDALWTLVQAEAEIPGRKVILYFNPWFSISDMVKEQYKSMIGAANRANVSFYTVDPKGLVTWNQAGGGQDLLRDAAKDAMDKQMRHGVGEVSTWEARQADRYVDSVSFNPLGWLRDLARQTGGTAIVETNDWKAPLQSAMEEVQTYYEAAYTPQIANYDGKFREVSVKVDRPDVVVHTRSGYFALPPLKSGQQLYAYEWPLLNALGAPAAPNGLIFHAAAERFNDRGPKIEYMVTLEVPMKGLVFKPLADKKNALVDAAILAVVKDDKGEIVDKFSKDFAVQVLLDKVEAYQLGNLVQTFRTELPPGPYTLEAAVMDRNSDKIGVVKDPVSVPEPSTKLSLSDVVVVRRADPVKDDPASHTADAFYYPGGKVVPTLTDTLKGGPGNFLPFYFTVYPDPAIQDAPKLTMAFYKDGEYLGAAEAPLPPVQKDGRIQYIADLPADKFVPGAYEIKVGITQGASEVERKVKFRVD